ncbi:MAG TPA: NAD(P)/FAD-dependent oxidoreductase, partial [Actinomycetota bacterium]|nr:NAD(P)/FAD-dependent oxidoreductase [Actinomycetota bacterium]
RGRDGDGPGPCSHRVEPPLSVSPNAGDPMHDVVIVGARCAGAPLAMLLARAGHDVLMVDRATFPSDTMSTHFIQSPGMGRLHEWGLIDAVFETNCGPVTTAFFDVGGEPLEFDIPLREPISALAAPRRTILDKLLVDAAVADGAQLAEGVMVNSLIVEDDRVVGIAGQASDGTFEARGRMVVGADGRHSVVARDTDALIEQSVDALTAGYYNYFPDTGVANTRFFLREDFVSVMFPTNDDLTLVAIAWRNERFAELRRDIEGNFYKALDELGEAAEGARNGRPAERWVGTADIPNFIRKTHGPGWALVGDAAYHKDPTNADGISDAFRGAALLADAIGKVLREGIDETTALDDYERAHDEAARRYFDPAVEVARLDLTPQERFQAFLQARMHNDTELAEVLGVEA